MWLRGFGRRRVVTAVLKKFCRAFAMVQVIVVAGPELSLFVGEARRPGQALRLSASVGAFSFGLGFVGFVRVE